jgi:hypothetical protein
VALAEEVNMSVSTPHTHRPNHTQVKARAAAEKAKDKEIDGLWKKMSDFGTQLTCFTVTPVQ